MTQRKDQVLIKFHPEQDPSARSRHDQITWLTFQHNVLNSYKADVAGKPFQRKEEISAGILRQLLDIALMETEDLKMFLELRERNL